MLVKLKDIANITAGQSPKSSNYTNSNSNGTPFLQGNRTFGIKYPYIDTYTLKVTKIAKCGDVLMSVRAPVGDLNIANQNMCIGRGLVSLSAKSGNNEFLYYLLKTNIKNIINKGNGTTYDSVTIDTIKEIEINIPENIEIQNKIACILSLIDNQIERNNLIVKKLQVLTHSTFDYFSKYNNHENKIVLNDLIIEKSKSQIQVNNIIDGSGYIPFFTSGESILYTDSSLTNGFNIFLSTGGNAKVQSYYGESSYSTDTWCITAKNNLQYYLYNYLKHIEKQMDELYFHGTGLKHLQKPLFLKSIIEVPSNDAIKRFNSIVEPMYIQISKLRQINLKLQNLKDKLLPLLINQQLA